MLYTNTSFSLRNVLDEDQFVVEDVDTWFQHHDSLPCRSAGAGLGLSPSSCLPQPRLGPLHMVPHDCQPSFVSASRSDLMFSSFCSTVQHWAISWEFGSSWNIGLPRTGWQGWVLLKHCGWLREVHHCAHWWVQPHFHHVQNEGEFYFAFLPDPHLQSAEMCHGWWQRQLLAPKSEEWGWIPDSGGVYRRWVGAWGCWCTGTGHGQELG